MAPLKANLSIRRNNEPVHKSGRSSTSLLHSNGLNLHKYKTNGLILERKGVFSCTQQWDWFYFESINSQMLVDEQKKIKRGYSQKQTKTRALFPLPQNWKHCGPATPGQCQALRAVPETKGSQCPQAELYNSSSSKPAFSPGTSLNHCRRAEGRDLLLLEWYSCSVRWCWEGVEKVVENSMLINIVKNNGDCGGG